MLKRAPRLPALDVVRKVCARSLRLFWLPLLLVATIPMPAFADDPTPIGGIVLIVGVAALLVSTLLAALHRYFAVGLLILWLYPGFLGAKVSLVYIDSRVKWASYMFLATLGLYGWVTVWRFRRDAQKPKLELDATS